MINADRFLRQCESPACSNRRGSWRALLEAARGYILESHWYCSLECFERAFVSVVGPFLAGNPRTPSKPHRIPLGLLMLSRGLVDNDQLKKALKAQKDSGSGRVGEWLRHIGAVSEEQVTQTLGVQWSVPVFPLNQTRQFVECARLLPLPLLEAAEMVPVHHIPTSQHLYVAFVDHVNYSALYAVEKMLQCHTEPCLAVQSQIVLALNELRRTPSPVEVLMDGLSDPWAMASALSALIEKLDATETRVSGFDGLIWTRTVSPSGCTDLLFKTHGNRPALLAGAEFGK
jgi:hypothetical protein